MGHQGCEERCLENKYSARKLLADPTIPLLPLALTHKHTQQRVRKYTGTASTSEGEVIELPSGVHRVVFILTRKIAAGKYLAQKSATKEARRKLKVSRISSEMKIRHAVIPLLQVTDG